MAEMQQPTANAAEPEAALDPATAAIYEQKAAELQQLVAQQVMAADSSKPTTMTELLADEQGAFASKAQELGLAQEWEQFKAAQPEIGQMRQEFLEIEEKRSAAANAVADITPQLDQQAAGVRKTGGVAAAVGAIASGAAAGFGASKLTQSRPVRAIAAVVGALVGGVAAGTAAIRKSMQNRMQKIGEQVGGLDNLQPDPKLEERAAELHQKLGEAQQQSMETMVEAMVDRMTQNEIAAQQAQELAAQQAQATTQAPQQEQQEQQQSAAQAAGQGAAPAAQDAAAPAQAQAQPAGAEAAAQQPAAAQQGAPAASPQEQNLDALLAELQQASQQTQQAGMTLAEGQGASAAQLQPAAATPPQAPAPQPAPAQQPAGSHVEALQAARAQAPAASAGRG